MFDSHRAYWVTVNRKDSMQKADYGVIQVEQDRVFIVDLNLGGPTITNAAETVARDLQRRYKHRRVIYRDTLGKWTEMRINARNVVLFAPYNEHIPDCDIQYVEV